MRLALAAALIMGSLLPASAAPRVIASVVPIHAIVAAVMQGVGEPELLLKGSLSEHRASFTPAQVADLGKADVVFIVGRGLEAKLAQIGGSEAVNGKGFVELSAAPGVKTRPIRQGGAWEPDTDEPTTAAPADSTAEGVLAFDPHVWLDPENAKAMAFEVADVLAKADPVDAAAYHANATAFGASLDTLSQQIATELAPVKAAPFIVFHDAYQYFEARFGLAGVGSISDVSARAPSAQRIAQIRQKLAEAKARCVFREPQFDDRMVNAVIEGSDAREGVLDPLGASLTPGPTAYQQLLKNLADNLKSCLAG